MTNPSSTAEAYAWEFAKTCESLGMKMLYADKEHSQMLDKVFATKGLGMTAATRAIMQVAGGLLLQVAAHFEVLVDKKLAGVDEGGEGEGAA